MGQKNNTEQSKPMHGQKCIIIDNMGEQVTGVFNQITGMAMAVFMCKGKFCRCVNGG